MGTDTDNNQLNAAAEEAVAAMLVATLMATAGNGITDDDYGVNGNGDSGDGDNNDGVINGGGGSDSDDGCHI